MVGLVHKGMVTDKNRKGKDFAWHKKRQADEARHFISLERDHSFPCIRFCFSLFLILVLPVVFADHTLNDPFSRCKELFFPN